MFGLVSCTTLLLDITLCHHLSTRIITVLLEVLPELLENIPLAVRRRMWFQQDRAPAHFHNGGWNYPNVQFPNRWIGRNGPVAWPPRSPDMVSLDFSGGTHEIQCLFNTCVIRGRSISKNRSGFWRYFWNTRPFPQYLTVLKPKISQVHRCGWWTLDTLSNFCKINV